MSEREQDLEKLQAKSDKLDGAILKVATLTETLRTGAFRGRSSLDLSQAGNLQEYTDIAVKVARVADTLEERAKPVLISHREKIQQVIAELENLRKIEEAEAQVKLVEGLVAQGKLAPNVLTGAMRLLEEMKTNFRPAEVEAPYQPEAGLQAPLKNPTLQKVWELFISRTNVGIKEIAALMTGSTPNSRRTQAGNVITALREIITGSSQTIQRVDRGVYRLVGNQPDAQIDHQQEVTEIKEPEQLSLDEWVAMAALFVSRNGTKIHVGADKEWFFEVPETILASCRELIEECCGSQENCKVAPNYIALRKSGLEKLQYFLRQKKHDLLYDQLTNDRVRELCVWLFCSHLDSGNMWEVVTQFLGEAPQLLQTEEHAKEITVLGAQRIWYAPVPPKVDSTAPVALFIPVEGLSTLEKEAPAPESPTPVAVESKPEEHQTEPVVEIKPVAAKSAADADIRGIQRTATISARQQRVSRVHDVVTAILNELPQQETLKSFPVSPAQITRAYPRIKTVWIDQAVEKRLVRPAVGRHGLVYDQEDVAMLVSLHRLNSEMDLSREVVKAAEEKIKDEISKR